MRVPTVPLVAACALLLFIAVQRLRKAQHEADTLRRSNAYLKDELELLRLNHESGPAQLARTTPAAVECPKPAPCPTASFAAAPTTTASTSSSDLSAALLEAHAHWDWHQLVKEMLLPFSAGIEEMQLETGVKRCNDNGTMYCTRIQVVANRLYITDYRAIFFDRHYAPARIMLLLELLKRRSIPDLDLVVAAVDEPRVKTKVESREWSRMIQRYPAAKSLDPRDARTAVLPPPLFSSTVNRAHLDLPWADFSFFMPRRPHKLRTPPWSLLHGKMYAESATVKWETKIELAMHTGNVGSPFRKRLAAVAEKNPETMFVNELFIGDHVKIKQTCREKGMERVGGYQKHQCYMTFTDQCSYKYLLNSASIGYANKFKYLLLCGSVVIYVGDGMTHKEFYEYGLLPGVHYVYAATAADVPATVRYLRKNDAYARAVAAAGRARVGSLSVEGVAHFFGELFTQYSSLQRFKVRPQPGAVEINCEDDLWRHYARDPHWMRNYLMEDNATCIRPIPPGTALGPPGWGGAYAGSKPRCYASHDLNKIAQPEACSKAGEPPNTGFQPGTSFEPYGKFPWAHPRERRMWTEGLSFGRN